MRKKKMVLMLSVFLIFIIVPLLIILGKFVFRSVDTGSFLEYNTSKMIIHLENKYELYFPQGIQNLKSAKSGTWDNYTAFILKFTINSTELEKFMKNAVVKSLYDYNISNDNRYLAHESVPIWWKMPIYQGKWGYIYVKIKSTNDGKSRMKIFIDTSSKENIIVYIRGAY